MLGSQTTWTCCPISNCWITLVTGRTPRALRSFLNLYRVFFRGPLCSAMRIHLIYPFHVNYVKSNNTCRSVQDLRQTRRCPSLVAGYQFFNIQAGFTGDLKYEVFSFFSCISDIKNAPLTYFICSSMGYPCWGALMNYSPR